MVIAISDLLNISTSELLNIQFLTFIQNIQHNISEQRNWIFVAAKKECGDDVPNESHPESEGIKTIDDCANTCKGKSTMFAFGTNDFELNRCTVEGCRCLCELSASEDGTCKEVENIGYRLYKYRRFGKM